MSTEHYEEIQQSVTDRLIDAIRTREQQGIIHYGTKLFPFNGRNALHDALEEALDLAQYIMQEMMEREQYIEVRTKLYKENQRLRQLLKQKDNA